MKGVGIRGVGLTPPSMMGYSSVLTLYSYLSGLGPIVYYKLDETAGVTAINYGTLGTAANGTYGGGVTLNQIAAPGGTTAPLWGGVDGYLNIYSAALAAGFDGNELTILIWFKADASVWTDGKDNRIFQLSDGGTNYVIFNSTTSINVLQFLRSGSGTAKNAVTSAYSNTNWHLMVMTATDSGDAQKHYMDGAQVGGTLTGLGTFIGPLAADRSVIGAQTSAGLLPWFGYLAHAAIYDKVLTAEEIAAIYALGSI